LQFIDPKREKRLLKKAARSYRKLSTLQEQ